MKGITNVTLDTMLRGLLHPSEYKEILHQVSVQPSVTYGIEKRLSDIEREKLLARRNLMYRRQSDSKPAKRGDKGTAESSTTKEGTSNKTSSTEESTTYSDSTYNF